jgi:hypothetical protein
VDMGQRNRLRDPSLSPTSSRQLKLVDPFLAEVRAPMPPKRPQSTRVIEPQAAGRSACRLGPGQSERGLRRPRDSASANVCEGYGVRAAASTTKSLYDGNVRAEIRRRLRLRRYSERSERPRSPRRG